MIQILLGWIHRLVADYAFCHCFDVDPLKFRPVREPVFCCNRFGFDKATSVDALEDSDARNPKIEAT